ncbi:hypothetical protein L798_00275 [Zootermopsis nevadensis]|uniref:Uncharacterized protein n=1 Tax=Zootermopsis nevadensis TaxID=136037 RepID=A0A067QYQ4_ZOONE|nr:hypothetical protein L798_00275 [Zootermopsis nevadensis]
MEYHARWASQLLADVGTEFCRCCDIVWRTDGIPIRDTLSVAAGSGPFVKYLNTQQGAAHADRSQMVKTAGGKLEFRLQFALQSFVYGLTVRPNMKIFLLHFTKSTTSLKWLSQTADIVLQNCFSSQVVESVREKILPWFSYSDVHTSKRTPVPGLDFVCP